MSLYSFSLYHSCTEALRATSAGTDWNVTSELRPSAGGSETADEPLSDWQTSAFAKGVGHSLIVPAGC